MYPGIYLAFSSSQKLQDKGNSILSASFLSASSQRVSLHGSCPEAFRLKQGIGQGSCLGPLLFTQSARKLFEVVKKHLLSVHVFTDDTQLIIGFLLNPVVL